MNIPLPILISYNLSIFGLIIIIFIVGLRDLKSKVNQRFLLFSFFVLAYTVATFINNFAFSPTITMFLLRLDLFIANFIPATFYAFSLAFSNYRINKKWLSYTIYFLLIPLSVIAFLPQTVTEVTRGKFGVNITGSGPLYYLTLIYFVAVLTISFVILYKNSTVSDRVTKQQTFLITFGLGTTVGINLVAVYLLPFFKLVDVGNLFSSPSIVILVASIGYALLRHHMFDIRTVILRSAGFFLIVGITAGLFVAGILASGALLIPGLILKPSEYAFIILSSVIAGMIFKPTTDFLEKKFNKAFAIESYDAQEILNRVGGLVASTVDVDDLCINLKDIVTSGMKISRIDIVVVRQNQTIYNTTDVNSYPTDEEFKALGDEDINIDEITDQDKLAILRKYKVNFYIVLKSHDAKVGYLLIGPKNNGLAYNDKDIKTLITIADELSVAFNNIGSFVEIQQFNKSLQEKIDAATFQLKQANEKLKIADSNKDDFVSILSHQLTAPLATIEGNLSLATNGYLGEVNPKLAEALKSAADRTRVMKGLITDLLNVSRMATGNFKLDLKEMDLQKIVNAEVDFARPLAKTQQVELNYHKPEQGNVEILCDETKLRQVVVNFITNAINYSPKGHVDVYLIPKLDSVEFRVVDDGIGVPENQKAKLFEKFFRADNAKKERPSGSGIGLYLAKRVIDEHGGSIIFKSTQGHGSTFGFIIPTKPSSQPVPEVARAQATPVAPKG